MIERWASVPPTSGYPAAGAVRGGTHKIEAIRVVLECGHATALITDETTGRALLKAKRLA